MGADADALKCVVESVDGSERFYAKHGFEVIEKVNLADEMPQKWRGRPEQSYTWMIRPAKRTE